MSFHSGAYQRRYNLAWISVQDYLQHIGKMFTKAGIANIKTVNSKQALGLGVHKIGGVRMGHDPKASLSNKYKQLHACKNVFVTDGACMT